MHLPSAGQLTSGCLVYVASLTSGTSLAASWSDGGDWATCLLSTIRLVQGCSQSGGTVP
jgi:hypothetical protein